MKNEGRAQLVVADDKEWLEDGVGGPPLREKRREGSVVVGVNEA